MENEKEKKWSTKYNKENFEIAYIDEDAPEITPEYLEKLGKNIELFEKHIGEQLPKDFRKYLLYYGDVVYHWIPYQVELYNYKKEECLFCSEKLAETHCKDKKGCTIPKDADYIEVDLCEMPGVLEIAHEGCGFFYYLVVKGNQKGSVWRVHANSHITEYTRVAKTFKEYMNNVLGDE